MELEKSVELFVMEYISDMLGLNYWYTSEKVMVCAKENIPKELIIDDTCFTSFATIGGNLFTIHFKKIQ